MAMKMNQTIGDINKDTDLISLTMDILDIAFTYSATIQGPRGGELDIYPSIVAKCTKLLHI